MGIKLCFRYDDGIEKKIQEGTHVKIYWKCALVEILKIEKKIERQTLDLNYE